MEKLQTLNLKQTTLNDSFKNQFAYYARPLTAKLLETMELSKHFHHGEGDYLFYEENNRLHKILDLTGGYGANILGHRNPHILAKVQEWHDHGAPSLTQGSVRLGAGKLAKLISDTLQEETSEGPWVSTFSNSGTEAIEAAYKHCLIHFRHKLLRLEQEVDKEINISLISIKQAEPSIQKRIVAKLRTELLTKIDSLKMNEERKSYFMHQVANTHEIEEIISLVREINQKQLSQRPSFISLEKAYHGKTMGSLSLTYNEGFRNSFYLDESNNEYTHFISQYIDQVELENFIASTRQDLIVLEKSSMGLSWSNHAFTLLAAAFVEPIQGEAGIIPVSTSFLALLKKHSLQEGFLLVYDEIQSGMYRTGRLSAGSHTDITADIYTFSKSLGGGVAKIGATTINQRKYIEDFGFLHTSTFSDDDFSSSVAIEVLNLLQGENSPVNNGMKSADYLWARLDSLKAIYPEVIKEIRGKGLLLAIEFNDLLVDMGFEFKSICDSKMQGYMIASVLLNHEGVRMSPSLSNSLTLRIQPSLFINIIQIEEAIAALVNVCEALRSKNISYFLSAIYPNQPVENIRSQNAKIDLELGKRPLAVFLCHLIDEAHLKKISRPLKDAESTKLMHKLALTKDISEFELYHTQTITDSNGKEIDIVMLGVSITSEELKKTFVSKNKYKLVKKIQNALDYAKELGASTVGLGQFTSIVSGNGLYLNSHGMNLTTGNAYTVALTVQSALRSASEKNIKIEETTVALIGAAGNIMSVASSLMADHVKKLILIHHSPVDSSLKFQEATKRILNDIATSKSDSQIAKVIRETWIKDLELTEYLNLPEIKNVFEATNDITLINQADIVLCGASASNSFLTLDMFKNNSVIVDIAVPQSLTPEMISKIETDRPDLTYHLGGVAQIPNSQSIDTFIFPLENNECYACMAETFALGFSGEKNFLNIGDLSKKIVLEVQEIAAKVGFELGNYKKKNSL